jgi:hypothetical protein
MPAGIVTLETKAWGGFLSGSPAGEFWLRHGRDGRDEAFLNPAVQNLGHVRAVARFVADGVVRCGDWWSALAAMVLLAVLDAARGQILQRCAVWVEQTVAPESFVRAIEAQLRFRPYRMQALRDLAVCRAVFGSPAVLALYDVPRVPVYRRQFG